MPITLQITLATPADYNRLVQLLDDSNIGYYLSTPIEQDHKSDEAILGL